MSAIYACCLRGRLIKYVASGMRYIFIHPYSPDYNPIELAFSAIKSRIRRDGELMRMTRDGADNEENTAKFYQHVFATTEEDAKGWFHHCGYD